MVSKLNKNTKVGVIGGGINGVDSCQFLYSRGVRNITLLDVKPLDYLKKLRRDVNPFGVTFVTGKEYLKELDKYDMIIRSPGVYRYLPELIQAEKKGVIITSPSQIFLEQFPGKTIGVTGTKGKGTTSSLVHYLLKKTGLKVNLAGNIGIPMLASLKGAKASDVMVLELSSSQLQDMSISPTVAVITNITSDHLDFHKSREEYVLAKKQIVAHQKKSNWTILNANSDFALDFANSTLGKKGWFSIGQEVEGCYVVENKIWVNWNGQKEIIGDVRKLLIPGIHNWENSAAAITVVKCMGLENNEIKKHLFRFKGLPHHLEFTREIKGVTYYNDSFSTNPMATIAALKYFSKPAVLIVGGRDKKISMDDLGKEISKSPVEHLIVIGQVANQIIDAAQKAGYNGKVHKGFKTMKEIVNTATRVVPRGGVVLLSPGCSSKDMFIDHNDRGKQFDYWVGQL